MGRVRLALSSGLSRERIAQDLSIGSSTLKKWIRDAQQHDTVVADATDGNPPIKRVAFE
ncbi:hypothetical protein [Acetobacter fabarum]|uniref:hypothetical protein n=1 Tax=Acetobacter fabarum TaxID=483199 RepID=UPI0039E95623